MTAPDNRGWMTNAACAYTNDPDLWFPDTDNTPIERIELAVGICNQVCPVRAQCAAHAIATRQRHGIAAGIQLTGATPRDNARKLIRHINTDPQPAEPAKPVKTVVAQSVTPIGQAA